MSERVDSVEKRLSRTCGCLFDSGKTIKEQFLPEARCLAQQQRIDAIPCEKPVTNGTLFKGKGD